MAPGKGKLDYSIFLREVERLDPEMPILIEYLESQEEYTEAFDHIKGVAEESNISLR